MRSSDISDICGHQQLLVVVDSRNLRVLVLVKCWVIKNFPAYRLFLPIFFKRNGISFSTFYSVKFIHTLIVLSYFKCLYVSFVITTNESNLFGHVFFGNILFLPVPLLVACIIKYYSLIFFGLPIFSTNYQGVKSHHVEVAYNLFFRIVKTWKVSVYLFRRAVGMLLDKPLNSCIWKHSAPSGIFDW